VINIVKERRMSRKRRRKRKKRRDKGNCDETFEDKNGGRGMLKKL
jgi:hypothetical protein